MITVHSSSAQVRSELNGAACSQRGENVPTSTLQLVYVLHVCVAHENVTE